MKMLTRNDPLQMLRLGGLRALTVNDNESRVMFLHRTIGEYLAGKCLARRIGEGDTEAWALAEKKSWASEWKQVILFCAGSLTDATPLLKRLSNPKPTDENPRGDDVLRHRLLLAAQCLPELSTYCSTTTQDIVDDVMRTYRMGFRLMTDVASEAIRALITIGAKYQGEPVQHVLRVETSTSCYSPAAYTPELFDILLEKLWEACESDNRRVMGTRRPPFPIARALVAICYTIDINSLRRSMDDPPDQYWRVIGEVFRQATHESSTYINIDAEFLRYLSSFWLNGSISSPPYGLSRAVEYLPSVSDEVLRKSSLVTECVRVLQADNSQALQERALKLLTSLGPHVGDDEYVLDSLANLHLSISERLLTKTIRALHPSLANERFIERLVPNIEAAEGRSRQTGLNFFASLGDTEIDAWNRALDRIVLLPGADHAISQKFAASPSRNYAKVICRLLKSENRSVGVHAVDALVGSVIKGNFTGSVSEYLAQLDFVTPCLVQDGGHASFHATETLEAILTDEELGVRLLLPGFLLLACIHRPSKALVDWGVAALSNPTIDPGDRAMIADTFTELPTPEIVYLKEKLHQGEHEHIVDGHLIMAATVIDDQEKVAAIIKTANAGWENKLQAVGCLPMEAVADPDIVGLVVDHLEQRTHRKTKIVINALTRIAPAMINSIIASKIIRAMCGRHGQEFVAPVMQLAKRNPLAFVNPLENAYFDDDNPGHDDIGEVLPALGDALVDSSLLDRIKTEATGVDRHITKRAIRLLARTLCYCSQEHREKLSEASASMICSIHANQLLRHEDVTPQFVQWLIDSLESDVTAYVRSSARMLMARVPIITNIRQRKRLIEVHSKVVPDEFAISVITDSDAWLQGLARASSGFLRIFHQDDKRGTAVRVEQLAR